MPAFDVITDIHSRLGSRPIVLPVDPLSCEHPEEALGRRIIGATADGTHAAGHLVRGQKPLVFLGGKLAAAVRVENDGRPARPLPHGHEHGLDDELAILPRLIDQPTTSSEYTSRTTHKYSQCSAVRT